MSPTRSARAPRHAAPRRPLAPDARAGGRRLAAGVAAGVLLAPVAAALPAQADDVASTSSGALTVTGQGFGHGRGMSQYGARGAALAGLDVYEILDFYYPGTSDYRVGGDVRVRLDDRLNGSGFVASSTVAGALRLTDTGDGSTWVLDRDPQARVTVVAGAAVLQVGSGSNWFTVRTLKGQLRVEATSGYVALTAGDGSTRSYRGSVSSALSGDGKAWAVNAVGLEDYLRGVVPSEMPTSWPAEAVRAQAVAARSYAIRLKDSTAGRLQWDLCSTEACQVYKGVGVEDASGSSAVAATAGLVRLYGGKAALTEFSSSDGGWTAAGNLPYQVAKADPYEAGSNNPNTSWTTTVPTSALNSAFPTVGGVQSVQVTARDGNGKGGGRVLTVRVVGASGATEVTGAVFRARLGLKSNFFTTPLSPISARYASVGGRLGAPTGEEYAVTGGVIRDYQRGSLYYSPSTGVAVVAGAIRDQLRSAGGTARYGFPMHDEFAPAGPAGSVAQGYTGADAWWSGATGAHFITGGILAASRGLGGVSALGLPLEDEHVADGTTTVVTQRFQRSTAFWSAATGTHFTRNGIDEEYRAKGGLATYGAPVEEEHVEGGAVVQRFERGRATWTPAAGVVLTAS